MSRRYPVHAITHIHTRASNGPASEMDGMISGTLRSFLGQDTKVDWSECFTPISRLVELLRSDQPRRVGLIAVTDHMNARSHQLPDELLAAAAADPRLAAGGEFNTVDRDTDGVLRRAPEVLIYGRPERVAGPFGPHFGLSQADIDELYATCRAVSSGELSTLLVMDHCQANGIAYALAHPFDGHALSLEACLDLISKARFVETVNGGFPEISTRILEDLVAFQNRMVSGFRLPARTGLRFPLARRLAEHIQREGRGMLHPWGGSDAHSHAFDRVVIRFLASRPDPNAGDLAAAMLRPVEDLLVDGTFATLGAPGTVLSVLDDVVRIVIRNIWSNREHVWYKPVDLARMVTTASKVVQGELSRRAERQRSLVRSANRDFDSAHILREMISPQRSEVPRRQDEAAHSSSVARA